MICITQSQRAKSIYAYDISTIHFNGFLKKDNVMTREEVVALLKKGEEYPNYYYSPEDYIFFRNLNENKTEYYIKDGVVKCVNNGNLLRWENYNTDEVISIMGKNNERLYAGISSLKSYYDYGDEAVLYSQRGFIKWRKIKKNIQNIAV